MNCNFLLMRPLKNLNERFFSENYRIFYKICTSLVAKLMESPVSSFVMGHASFNFITFIDPEI